MPVLLTLFRTGTVVATPGALAALLRTDTPARALIDRHLVGDWGELSPEDVDANNDAVRDGYRILSAYTLSDGTKVWVITEADRETTTLLLPDEY